MDYLEKVLDLSLKINRFEFQSSCYVHFQAKTVGKGMKRLIHPAMC